jgi:hypothetical protein
MPASIPRTCTCMACRLYTFQLLELVEAVGILFGERQIRAGVEAATDVCEGR